MDANGGAEMNAWRVAEEFRLVAEGDVAFSGVACVNEQTGGTGTTAVFPRLVFSAAVRALGRSIQVGTATVTISVESHAQDTEADAAADLAHWELIEKVRGKFFGDNDAQAMTQRAIMASRISAAGRLDVDPRYVPIESDPGIEGHRFKTPLMLKCGVCFPTL